MSNSWAHLQQIAQALTLEFGDAVFIGAVAVAAHAKRLGAKVQEVDHDAELCLSILGKAMMRDRYDVRRVPHLGKESILIEGKDIDLYVEHLHPLGIPYAGIFAHSEDVHGVRVAALEHLLILKLDAAGSRWGPSKGEKDVRHVARILGLMDHPREELLAPHLNAERKETLDRVMGCENLSSQHESNPHEGNWLRDFLDVHPTPVPEAIQKSASPQPMAQSFAAGDADLSISAPLPLRGQERLRALRHRTRTIADVCAEADVRCRVTGGIWPKLVLWHSEHHGYTVDDAGIPLYAVSRAGLPQRKQQRALRILEILAYGFQDYIARESVCGRGFFVYPVAADIG